MASLLKMAEPGNFAADNVHVPHEEEKMENQTFISMHELNEGNVLLLGARRLWLTVPETRRKDCLHFRISSRLAGLRAFGSYWKVSIRLFHWKTSGSGTEATW